MNRRLNPRTRRDQRGIAALVVVMVLFFVVTLVAAYANRNFIFEQRTSANQYRSTQALEAAQAGLEWALAMLNHSRIDASCATSASALDTSFRQRYIATDTATGKLTPVDPTLRPSCVFDGTNWVCSCPSAGNPVLAAPAGTGVFPAFRVRFQYMNPAAPAAPPQPGVIKVEVVACTRLDNACLDFDGTGVPNEGRAVVGSMVAITGNLASPPQVSVLARGQVNFGATMASLAAYNTNPGGTGITIEAGGAVDTTGMTLQGIAGTPSALTVVPNDSGLSSLVTVSPFAAEDRMFAVPFNMQRTTFRDQPAAVVMNCGGTCSAAALRNKIAMNPGRPIWINGNLSIDSAGNIGGLANVTLPDLPVLLVVNGDLSFATPGVTIYGLAYLRTATWTTSGSGQIQGGVVAEGNIAGNGALTVVHDPDLLQRLKASTGSIVRVPGSWKDFPCPSAAPLC